MIKWRVLSPRNRFCISLTCVGEVVKRMSDIVSVALKETK
jgi:hypothetical protein